MVFKDLFKSNSGNYAEKEITIIGVNPIIGELIKNAKFFSDLLRCNKSLKITIIYESETENFNQSLFYDKEFGDFETELERLQTFRGRLIGGKKAENEREVGFFEDVLFYCTSEEEKKDFEKRLLLLQNNLRHNINLIKADEAIQFSLATIFDINRTPLYQKIDATKDTAFYQQMNNFIDYLLDDKKGGLYLSKPGEELIQLYDNEDFPRGIYPRKAFYTTDFQRYSIWAFIFNRNGELLLQRRSDFTADNRSLWDKSAGGHVDLKDSSTIQTAKREVVEELFMPDAEYTRYMQDKIDDFIDFGEWNIKKRAEKHFKGAFEGLDSADWVVFRATEKNTGAPLTVKRESIRTMHEKQKDEHGNIIYVEKQPRSTMFISDVYLFIAPEGCIDNDEQMAEVFAEAEKKGAASTHKLLSIDDLLKDIKCNPKKYTDDMVYVGKKLTWLLVQFSEFIKYIFEK